LRSSGVDDAIILLSLVGKCCFLSQKNLAKFKKLQKSEL
jgi:hypothetical protein